MSRALFVNLPVFDVLKAVDFWTGLGFEFNPMFGDDHCACMVFGDQTAVMLLEDSAFHRYHDTQPAFGTEALMCISANSRAEVDELCRLAFAAGATPAGGKQDGAGLYGWAFRDPDGHIWEVLWMEV